MHSCIFASPVKMGDSESMHDCAAASTHGQEQRPQRDLSRDLHLRACVSDDAITIQHNCFRITIQCDRGHTLPCILVTTLSTANNIVNSQMIVTAHLCVASCRPELH